MKSSMSFFLVILFSTLFFSSANVFASDKNENLIAVGQGISLPASTSTVNFSNGDVITNPVGVLYQDGGRLSLENNQTESGRNNRMGAELGYAGEVFAGALGYSKNCNSCGSIIAVDGAAQLNNLGVGLSIRENLIGLGAIYGIRGDHRWGLMLNMDEGGTSTGKLLSYGIGYSYVQPVYSLTLDVSRRDGSRNDAITVLTPGVSLNVINIQLSVNDKILLNKETNVTYDSFWFGLGLNRKEWALALYSDYINDYSFVVSTYF